MRRYVAQGEQPFIVKESIWKWPMIILTGALSVPSVRALWMALDAITMGAWEIIGVVLISIMFLVIVSIATVALYLWIRAPGQQLPDWAQPLERKLEN